MTDISDTWMHKVERSAGKGGGGCRMAVAEALRFGKGLRWQVGEWVR